MVFSSSRYSFISDVFTDAIDGRLDEGGETMKLRMGPNSAFSTSSSSIGSPSMSDVGLAGKLDPTGLVLRNLWRDGTGSVAGGCCGSVTGGCCGSVTGAVEAPERLEFSHLSINAYNCGCSVIEWFGIWAEVVHSSRKGINDVFTFPLSVKLDGIIGRFHLCVDVF